MELLSSQKLLPMIKLEYIYPSTPKRLTRSSKSIKQRPNVAKDGCLISTNQFKQSQTSLIFRNTKNILIKQPLLLLNLASFPFHKNLLNICSVTQVTFLGKINVEVQYLDAIQYGRYECISSNKLV